MLERLILEHKTAARVWYLAVWHGYGPAVLAGSFTVALVVLQWVFNYELFYEILIKNEARLALEVRLDVFIDAIFNVFRYGDDVTPVSLILISFFQASIVTIWWRVRLIARIAQLRVGALGVGLLGSGCVACGSSLLPAVVRLFGSTLPVGLAQTVGDSLLLLAVVLSYRAALKLALRSSGSLS